MSEGVNYVSLSKNQLKNTLLKVLKDSSYTSNAIKWSSKFREQKEHPLDRAVWWIEWLIRNPDSADYLRSPVLQLGYIAGNGYDIIAYIIIIFVVLFCILFRIIQNAYKTVLKKTDSSSCYNKKYE